MHVGEDDTDLFAAEEDGKAGGADGADDVVDPGEIAADDVAIEEKEGGEGLVLARGGEILVCREGGEEGGDVGGAELARVAKGVEMDVADDPQGVGALGALAVVAGANGGAELVEQARVAFDNGVGCAIARGVGTLEWRCDREGSRRRELIPWKMLPAQRFEALLGVDVMIIGPFVGG
jgi:hypothetical protein